MNDLISRQDAIIALLEKGQRSRRYKLGEIWELNFDEIREALATVPSAEPVRHGKWIFESICGHAVMTCSECLKVQSGQTLCFTYCPNCGARMDGERKEE